MKGHFDMQQLLDLGGKDCARYANLFFPFGNLPDTIKPSNESKLLMSHMDLVNKYSTTQNKINEYVDFRKSSIKKIDDEIGEYLKIKNGQDTISTLEWTNPSYKIKTDFLEIIELCALRLQDLARLCLQITEQPTNILQKTNLVNEYERLLQERYKGNTEILESFQEDHKWMKMLKDLRNEGCWHEGGDKNGRELNFHEIKVDLLAGSSKPVVQLPAFDFTGSEGSMRIDDFEYFFDILMYNIFDISIDRLVFAYAKKSHLPQHIIRMMIRSKWIDDQK